MPTNRAEGDMVCSCFIKTEDGREIRLKDIPVFSSPEEEITPFDIDHVIFNNPATIVFWKDGTKTIVRCFDNNSENHSRPYPSEEFSEEMGLAMAIAKKAYGNKGSFNNVFRKYIRDYDAFKED